MSSTLRRSTLRRPVFNVLPSRLLLLVVLAALLGLSFGKPRTNAFATSLHGSSTFHSRSSKERAATRSSELQANGKIAFASGRDTVGSRSQIYTMNADGSNVVRLTNNLANETQPHWSPDGSRIVFTTDRDKVCDFFSCYSEIYLMSADGSNPVRLTNNTANDTSPVWSPDGNKIAFQSNRNGNYEIYVINADGSNAVRLTNNIDFDVLPSWSPDGNKLAFQRGINAEAEIYVMNANGSNQIRITNNGNSGKTSKGEFSGDVIIEPDGVEDTEPAWSPNGTRIAFSTNRDGHYEIYLMNTDGASQTRLTNDTSVQSGIPAWSPDGTKIVFTSANINDQNGTSFEISVMNADGSNRTKLTNNSTLDWEPGWQPLVGPTPTPTPLGSTTVQFSSGGYSVNEGESHTTIIVTRSGDLSSTSTVNYQTNDSFSFVECNLNSGLANQRCDYITTAGTLHFAANETSKTFSIPIVDDSQVEGNETLNLSLSNAAGGTLGSQNTAVLTISDNDTTAAATRLFVAQLSGAQETPSTNSTATGVGTVLLSIDETNAQVNLTFSGLSSTETAAHIHGPAHVEAPGPILFPLLSGTVTNQTINLTSSQVAQLKAGLFYFNVHTNNFPNGEIRGQILPNPLENARFFVRQQYYDFQNREPDQGGFDYWTNDQITSCGADLACITARRVRVADAFFFEPEFQQTGSYVFRLYRAAYGNTQPDANPEISQLPGYAAFIQDRAHVVGGGDLAQKQLALANTFSQRPEFLQKYPASLSGPQFVDGLLATILTDSGANLSSQRDTLIAHFNAGNRALVLFHLANDYWNSCGQVTAPCVPSGYGPAVDNRPFLDAEYNRGFVATMYFGFLRRDADLGGYNFWLGQVNSFALRSPVGQHRMVCGALITSQEYQQRFNLNFPRSDAECGAIQ
ncbi:MAG TPA: CHRD domain-containing protein [Pyrinomonadaceae bacterium]|nr:CHRD domain-containing protein [Pyrinomonadaceae bacterium]